VAITLFLVCVLLHVNTRSLADTGIVLLAVPFSLIGDRRDPAPLPARLQHERRRLGRRDRARRARRRGGRGHAPFFLVPVDTLKFFFERRAPAREEAEPEEEEIRPAH
jgi:hypothetical protein